MSKVIRKKWRSMIAMVAVVLFTVAAIAHAQSSTHYAIEMDVICGGGGGGGSDFLVTRQ